MDTLQTSIEEFIRKVPSNRIFDAHSVIEYLIENHSDEYLDFHVSQETTEHFHSRISKLIDSLCNGSQTLIVRMPDDSYSRNIHNRYDTNACWKKL